MIVLSCLQGRQYFNFTMCCDLHSVQRLELRPQELSPPLLEVSETLWKDPTPFTPGRCVLLFFSGLLRLQMRAQTSLLGLGPFAIYWGDDHEVCQTLRRHRSLYCTEQCNYLCWVFSISCEVQRWGKMLGWKEWSCGSKHQTQDHRRSAQLSSSAF